MITLGMDPDIEKRMLYYVDGNHQMAAVGEINTEHPGTIATIARFQVVDPDKVPVPHRPFHPHIRSVSGQYVSLG